MTSSGEPDRKDIFETGMVFLSVCSLTGIVLYGTYWLAMTYTGVVARIVAVGVGLPALIYLTGYVVHTIGSRLEQWTDD